MVEKSEKIYKQAGAELCQAPGQLRLAEVSFVPGTYPEINHFKTDFFFSTEAFKVYIYIYEKPENPDSPLPSYQKVQILNFGLFDFRQ